MQTVTFRLALAEEAEQLAQLINLCYRGENSRLGWTTEADLLSGLRTTAPQVLQLIQAEDSAMLVCLHEATLIGCLHLEKLAYSATSPPGGHFGMFVIQPSLQNRGLGKQLLTHAEHLVQTQWGIQRCVMHVITHRHELIAFYQRRGYQATGQLRAFPVDPSMWSPKVSGLALAVLEKRL